MCCDFLKDKCKSICISIFCILIIFIIFIIIYEIYFRDIIFNPNNANESINYY